MKTSKIALLATLLCAGMATPVLAAWDTIGTIEIDGRNGFGSPGNRDRDNRDNRGYGDRRDNNGFGNRDNNRNARVFDFGGPVEMLQFVALRGDINCQSVNATFGNGQTRNIFNGRLRENRPTNVNLPGRDRSILRLDFNCESDRGRSAGIRIVADVGRYRGEWQRSPDWQRTWSRMFNWGSNQINEWQLIGSKSFDGRGDQETSFAGRRGLRVDSIALKPLESDARCSRVVARFDNGRTQVLALHNRDRLSMGQYEKLDLPGDSRNVSSLTMRCEAIGRRQVTMQVFTSRS